MKITLFPFIGLAALGLFLSALVHLSALLGQPIPLGHRVWALHFGIFVVWIPAVIVGNLASSPANRKNFWKVALRGCPGWLRFLIYGLFGYAVVNFAIFIWRVSNLPRGQRMNEEVGLIGFSGHWMVFYAAALGILWSFVRADKIPTPRCVNGHPASADAKFCQECGSPVTGDPIRP